MADKTVQGGLPLEIERKFLIEMPDRAFLRALPGCRVLTISQTYLKKEGDYRARVRRTVCDGIEVYTHTAKRKISDMTRVELERGISEEEYEAFLKQRDPERHTIEKTRFAFPFGGHTVEIDVYPFWTDRATLEIELGSEDEEVLLPPFVRLIREVTQDRAYTNASLAADPSLHTLEFKKGLGWKACRDTARENYTAQRSWRGFYQLCEINKDIYDRLGTDAMGGTTPDAWIGKGRPLVEADDDYYTMPYCTVFDEDYMKIAPWSDAWKRDDPKTEVPKELADPAISNQGEEQ